MYTGKRNASDRNSKYKGQPSKIIFYNNRDRIVPRIKHDFNNHDRSLFDVHDPLLLKYNQCALKGSFYAADLSVKMISKYYYNSANYLSQEDLDILFSAPKFHVENYIDKGRCVNLSGEFRNANKKSDTKVKNVEYYVSLIDDQVHLFAVSYVNYRDVNSVSISYLPNGKVSNAVFLGRVCRHANEHINSDGTKINPFEIHLHKVSQKYYENVLGVKSGKHPRKIASAFHEADAIRLENQNEDVKKIAKKEFSLERQMSVCISSGKDNLQKLKANLKDKLQSNKYLNNKEYLM